MDKKELLFYDAYEAFYAMARMSEAFKAFCKDNLVRLDTKTARKLFDEMVENTKDYLTEYFK